MGFFRPNSGYCMVSGYTDRYKYYNAPNVFILKQSSATTVTMKKKTHIPKVFHLEHNIILCCMYPYYFHFPCFDLSVGIIICFSLYLYHLIKRLRPCICEFIKQSYLIYFSWSRIIYYVYHSRILYCMENRI